MTTILKQVKRASLASHRRAAAIARLRVALSTAAMETRQTPGLEALASLAQSYRLHIVHATQDLSVLEAHHSMDDDARWKSI